MTDRVSLATMQWGTGDRRALLLHGIASNAAGWWRLAPDLVELGFTVVAPDLRGHGSSRRGPEMSLEAYRDDVLALAESWDLVLGHSLGGVIAVLAVAARPAWTSRLVLEDPAVATSGDREESREWLLAPWQVPITIEQLTAEHPRWHPNDIVIKVDALRQCGAETIDRTVDDAAPWDVSAELVALAVPTLIVGADPDEALFGPEAGAEVEAANPAIEYRYVPNGSHSMHRDEYDAFWAILEPFVR